MASQNIITKDSVMSLGLTAGIIAFLIAISMSMGSYKSKVDTNIHEIEILKNKSQINNETLGVIRQSQIRIEESLKYLQRDLKRATIKARINN